MSHEGIIPTEQTPMTDNIVTNSPLDKDYDTVCCGQELCNVPPRTVLAAFFTIVGIGVSTVFLILSIGPQTVFVSLISSLVTLWAPSPLQNSSARRDLIQNASLLQTMYGDRLFNVQHGRFKMKQPVRMEGQGPSQGHLQGQPERQSERQSERHSERHSDSLV
jgi:hypothetical protein